DKPLLVTRPVDPQAAVDSHGYLSACEWLDAPRASHIVEQTDRVLADPEAVARLEHWVRHYFGDTAPGAATARFHAAIAQLMDRWSRWDSEAAPEEPDTDEADLDD
ncbi:MAG TPA: hypothetical protein DEA59_03780, partial [Microbacterium sp.]|nr:hypothetical protein [Microbacterium sp.]